ncbi:BAR-domain-containing protein [Ascoidea rubescens DSM 1968]|uniref:BAR-domain-containing protein n=1 Tax=Ascoidea rubescens DSM 1968 TaxID=1344418 RepID=A0A1D2VKZ3_9ASCO|nr:BAR-domain-containing protein [Ascoidea rubescens DSM 1968]ODV62217.1 BAR-domain-containing protein [Ascoidea rubescens DSM 1968]
MSWNGFKKAINRAGAQVMIKTGHVEKTVDREFDLEEKRFRSMEDSSLKLQKEAKQYFESLKSIMNSQTLITETFDSFYATNNDSYPLISKKSNSVDNDEGIVKNYLKIIKELNDETFKSLNTPYKETVLDPINKFCFYFNDINEAIKKRNHKKIDYDSIRSKVKKLSEKPSDDLNKIPKLEKELNYSKDLYESLNSELKLELPQLISLRVPYLDPSFESLVKIQLRFFTDSYTRLSQVQNSFDAESRDAYANEQLDQKVDDVLQRMRELSITASSD